MDVQPGEPARNLRRAEELLRSAATYEPEVVCLPEMVVVGDGNPHGQFREMAEPIPGPHSDRFVAWAIEHGVYIVVGLMERCEEGCYSSAILVSPTGEILLKHRQVHNAGPYLAGDSFRSVDTPIGLIELAVCGDAWEQSFRRHIRRERPDWIFVPMDWCGEDDERGLITDQRPPRFLTEWRTRFRRASLQSGSTLYAVNAWGPDDERECGACGGAFMFSRGREVKAPGIQSGCWRRARGEQIHVFESGSAQRQ